MRHRIKKIPTLKHLLHSDKSTYRSESESWFTNIFSQGCKRFYLLRSCAHTSFFGRVVTNVTLCLRRSIKKTSFLYPRYPRHFGALAQVLGRAKEVFAALKSNASPKKGIYGGEPISRRKSLSGSVVDTLVVPSCVSTALLLVLGMLIFPVGIVGSGEEVYAVEGSDVVARSIASPNASISFSISNSESGVISDTNDIVSTEVTSGIVSYISNNIAITTKDINKFYVTVQAASDGTSELIGTDHKAIINPVGSNKAPSEFGDNTWGYALTDNNVSDSSLDYNSLPTYSEATTPQYTSSNNVADDTYNLKLTFAAKINADKPADHYTTKAMVSVAADAKSLPTLVDLTNMQDMTSEVCGRSAENETKQLKDVRDSKTYWVTKLKDSNCWMTQNLDLDLYVNGAGRKLTQDDSHVPEAGWTSTTGASALWSTSGNNDVKYYDPGYKTMANGSGSPANATEALAKDTTGQTNAHYLQGNYYSWVAANAGDTRTSGNTTKDICPKGWQLPTSNNTNDKSFGKLMSGISAGSTLLASPYYYTYGGSVGSGDVNVLSSYGYYWSATANDSSYSYRLSFNSYDVNPSYNGSRYFGLSVRCVAQ